MAERGAPRVLLLVAALLLLAGVAGVAGGALWLTLGTDRSAAAAFVAEGRAGPAEGAAGAGAQEGRRHVGAADAAEDAAEDPAATDAAPSRAQRLQWIREWLEIACGDGYAWSERRNAMRSICEFDPDESVPLILEIACVPDLDEGGWSWALQILGMLGPRAEKAVPTLIGLMKQEGDRGDYVASTLGAIGAPAIDPLLACLVDADAAVYARAVRALAAVGAPPRRVIEALIDALGHPDADVRREAVGGFYRRQGTAEDIVIPALVAALSDADAQVRQHAVLGLWGRGEAAAPAVAALAATLDDDEEWVADWAARTLGRIGPAAAPQTEHLVALLGTAPDRWKDTLPEALSGIGTSALLQALVIESVVAREAVIAHVPDAVEADSATAPAAVAALDTLLADASADLRRAAADALGTLGPTASAAAPALLKLADDPDGAVRRSALIAVVRVGGDRDKVLAVLVRELTQGTDLARAAAAEALAALGPDAAPAVEALAGAMNDPDLVVRERAARALEAIGPAAIGAATAVAGRLGDDSERVRLAAAIALIAIDPPGLAARDTVAKLRISDSATIRTGVVTGLGRHPDATWLGVLTDRLDDRNTDVRSAAARALGGLATHGAQVVPALVARLDKERQVVVQMACVEALGRFGKDAAEALPLLERLAATTTLPPGFRRDCASLADRLR